LRRLEARFVQQCSFGGQTWRLAGRLVVQSLDWAVNHTFRTSGLRGIDRLRPHNFNVVGHKIGSRGSDGQRLVFSQRNVRIEIVS
jgi:hypothetical protein